MPTLKISHSSDLHKRLIKKIKARITLAKQEQEKQFDRWSEAEERTLAFLPETELDKARADKRKRGEPRYTTIQIPYSYGMLMAAHTYWTSVFFARSPVHQFTGRHGEGEMQVQAMEALIGYQVDVGRFMVPYMVWLYDMGKYALGILGQYWDRKKIHFGELVEMQGPDGSVSTYQVTQEIDGYVGNCVYNVSPWDWVSDPRVSAKHF